MPFQMALDKLLFEKHQSELNAEPTLRIYYSSEPWCTVGYAAEKNPSYALNESKHDLNSLPVCRRPTGGGTVIHGEDLIFSLLAHKQDDVKRFESLEVSYKHLHEAVKHAFQKLGQQTDFYEGEKLSPGRDCFLNPVETDLRLAGKKIAGGAQKRSGDFFLHEESIQPSKDIRLEDLERELILSLQTYFEIKIIRMVIDPKTLFEAEKLASKFIIKDSH